MRNRGFDTLSQKLCEQGQNRIKNIYNYLVKIFWPCEKMDQVSEDQLQDFFSYEELYDIDFRKDWNSKNLLDLLDNHNDSSSHDIPDLFNHHYELLEKEHFENKIKSLQLENEGLQK